MTIWSLKENHLHWISMHVDVQLPTKDRSKTLASSSSSHCYLWMGSCTKICQNNPDELNKYLYLVSECQLNLFKPMELAVQTPVCSWIKKALTSKSKEVRASCWNNEMIKGVSVPRLIVPTATYASASAGNQLHPDNSSAFARKRMSQCALFKFTFWPTSFVSYIYSTFVANPKKKI